MYPKAFLKYYEMLLQQQDQALLDNLTIAEALQNDIVLMKRAMELWAMEALASIATIGLHPGVRLADITEEQRQQIGKILKIVDEDEDSFER